ncbi:MAG: NIL domain-containing protein [Woronichinia naegeliana WA131]|jgi:ABC-type methionine transport system ATPase subunit|uniref:NIL domain-containing protein n=1 Tax=Woronichinia naegeliana WA131 TaxID=2824559 RepID=A0A977L2F1_9CYAN|nr:MAG: NIL domain-containing protein [Woronichinia naegeliana WA131]
MSINTLNPNVMESDRLISIIQNRIRIQIPSQYQQEPIISQLASNYHLEISILAAMLGANGEGNGWFDLLLTGSVTDINNGLDYLTQLGIEILDKSDQETDRW